MKESVLKQIDELDQKLEKAGNLDKKVIALIELALSLTIGNKEDFIQQLVNAKKQGASTAELNDVIGLVALVMGRRPLSLVYESGRVQNDNCC